MRCHPISLIGKMMLATVLCVNSGGLVVAQQAPQYAGKTDRGFLLPNGWTLTPAGEHISLTDLPLNIIPMLDNRHALAATSGYNSHELTVVDLQTRSVVDRLAVRQSWFGLAISPHADRIWWSGGGGNSLHAFGLTANRLSRLTAATPEPKTKSKVELGPFPQWTGVRFQAATPLLARC